MSSQNLPKLPNSHEQHPEQKSQVPAEKQLSDSQLRAVELLVGGARFSTIARELNIDRRTLYMWRKEDKAFQSELHRRRTELHEFGFDRFRNLTWLALDRIESQIRDQYAPISLPAARTIVSLAGLGKVVSTPDGLVHRDPRRTQREPLAET